eukprot:UC1_evm1s1984
MTVVKLRAALKKRGADTRGRKAQLQERLLGLISLSKTAVSKDVTETEKTKKVTAKRALDPSGTGNEEEGSTLTRGDTASATASAGEPHGASLQERLAALRKARQAGRAANQSEAAEEDRRAKLPSNFAAKRARAERELEETKARAEAEARGEDYERARYRNTSALASESYYAKRVKGPRGEARFSTHDEASRRRYEKNVALIKPDRAAYAQSQAAWAGDTGANTLSYGAGSAGAAVSAVGAKRMAADVRAHIQGRKNAARERHRAPHADAGIHYVNDKNRHYNESLERHYGAYTQGIKDSLER